MLRARLPAEVTTMSELEARMVRRTRAAYTRPQDLLVNHQSLFGGTGRPVCRRLTDAIPPVRLRTCDGGSVAESLRAAGKRTPILFLTARDSVEDRVKGLELGADDYLVKPFAFSELLARVRSILRRGPSRESDELVIGDLQIDFRKHKAHRAGKRLDLTPKEFALLSLLARHAGEVLSRTLIAEQVWDMNFDSETNVVDVHVRRLRSKVDDPYEKKLIHTVRGVGYVLEEREGE